MADPVAATELIQVPKPEIGRPTDRRIDEAYLESRPELVQAGYTPFIDGTDVDIIERINEALTLIFAQVRFASPTLGNGLIGALTNLLSVLTDLEEVRADTEQLQTQSLALAGAKKYDTEAQREADNPPDETLGLVLGTNSYYRKKPGVWSLVGAAFATAAALLGLQNSTAASLTDLRDTTSVRVQSPADLQAMTGFANGRRASTAYGLGNADLGGGEWVWNANSNQAHNGGTCVMPTGHIGPGRFIRMYSGPINIRWFGAQGNSYGAGATGNDDTAAIQAAINEASSPFNGAEVYAPAGSYRVNGSFGASWTASPVAGRPGTPQIFRFYGAGNSTTFRAFNTAAGRGVVEFLGESNLRAVRNVEISGFRVLQDPSCHEESWTVRIGDSFTTTLRHIVGDGANGLLLKTASTASYAQVNLKIESCVFNSNYGQGWGPESACTQRALGFESGGADMDNILFTSCIFNGATTTRAHSAHFLSTHFTVNPLRPATDAANVCLHVNGGSATLDDCYLEDHDRGILIQPGVQSVKTVRIKNTHFSGVGNFGTGSSRIGIHVLPGAAGLTTGRVIVEDCNVGPYTEAFIKNEDANATVQTTMHEKINDATQIKFLGPVRHTRLSTTTRMFFALPAASATTDASKGPGDTGGKIYIVDEVSWLSGVQVALGDNIIGGSVTLTLYKNGNVMFSEGVLGSPKAANITRGPGYFQVFYINPLDSAAFEVGDRITATVTADGFFSGGGSSGSLSLQFAT